MFSCCWGLAMVAAVAARCLKLLRCCGGAVVDAPSYLPIALAPQGCWVVWVPGAKQLPHM
jgi:hypothetical protein